MFNITKTHLFEVPEKLPEVHLHVTIILKLNKNEFHNFLLISSVNKCYPENIPVALELKNYIFVNSFKGRLHTIILRHVIRSKAVTNWIFSPNEKTTFVKRA